jgi:hypothetical protein
MYVRSVIAVATGAAMVLVAAPPAQAATIDKTPEPSAHADDGTVQNSVQMGGRLFIGGSFTRVDGAARSRLAVLNATSGQLESLKIDVDGEVTSLATDGSGTVFIGGKFNYVNGVRRNNLAAVNASTGAVVAGFNPAPAGIVRSLDYASGTVVFGGGFTKVGSTARNYLAAANAGTGALVSGFPSANGVVYAVKAGGGSIYVGGEFSQVGGTSRSRVAELSTSGAVLDYRTALGSPVYDIAVDSTGVYLATGGGLPSGNSLYKTTSTGSTVWQVGTNGNLQTVEVVGDTVYAGGHFDYICGTTTGGCGNTTLAKKAFVASATGSSASPRAWAKFNTALGVWDLTAAGGNLYALGVFTKVNGKALPRIARFQG